VTGPPLVSVVIPARNEAADIEACLAAIARQDHPINHLEVVVVDGDSDDGTGDIARRALGRYGFGSVAVVPNPVGTTPSNLNAGLARARGEIVCRVDARTLIEPHHVRTCADLLRTRPEVAVVGGSQVAIPRDRTARALGIARALNNRWSMGGARYRRAGASGPTDTVYLGAFRQAQLQLVGAWDERLTTNQDYDLNRRMGAHGLVWFEHTLQSGYVPRATFGRLWAQYRRFGLAKVRYWRLTGDRPALRQIVALAALPLAAAVGLLALRADLRLALVLLAAVGLIEHLGTVEPRGGPLARAAAIVAMGLIAVGWWTGVVEGWLRRRA